MWSPETRAAALSSRRKGARLAPPHRTPIQQAAANRINTKVVANRPLLGTGGVRYPSSKISAKPKPASNTAKANVAAHIPPIGKAKPTTAASIASKVSAYHSHVEANGPIVAPNLYYGGGAFPSSPMTSKSGAQYSQWKKRQQAKGVKFRPVTNDLLQHKSSGWGMGGG